MTASSVLLAIGLAIVVASCLAVAIMDDALDRLHMVTPAATLGVVLVSAAIVVRAGLSPAGLSAILVAAFIAGSSPFIAHAMARAILVSTAADDDAEADEEAGAVGDEP